MTEKDQVPDELVSQVGPAAWVPAWVLKVGLTDGELRIYVALRTFADRDGKAHPRPETVAQRASNAAGRPISVRSVHNAYGRFRQLGLIKTTRIRREDGTHGPVRVTLRDVPVRTTALPSAVAEPPHHAGENHRTTQCGKGTPHNYTTERRTRAPPNPPLRGGSHLPEQPPPTHPRLLHGPGPPPTRDRGGGSGPAGTGRRSPGCAVVRSLRRPGHPGRARDRAGLGDAGAAVPDVQPGGEDRMTTDPNASLPSVEEIAALAAQGPHLVTSWGLHGVFHRRCCCGRGTPPTGALTSATAESFVAACRAAQDWRDDEGRKDRATVVRGAAQDAQGARTDLAAGEGTDQNGSDDDSPGARLPTSVATTTGSES